MKKKYVFLLLFGVLCLSTFSCTKEERDYVPSIEPSHINLTDAGLIFYFKVSPQDCILDGILIDQQPLVNLLKYTNRDKTEINVSNNEKLIVYCKNNEVQKLDFGYMEIEKIEKTKYKVTKTKDMPTPSVVLIGFYGGNSYSSLSITFNKKNI